MAATPYHQKTAIEDKMMNSTFHSISYEIQSCVFTQVLTRLEYLIDEEIYTLPAILGEDFWKNASPHTHADLEMAFADFVAAGRFSFEPLNGNGEYRYINGRRLKKFLMTISILLTRRYILMMFLLHTMSCMIKF